LQSVKKLKSFNTLYKLPDSIKTIDLDPVAYTESLSSSEAKLVHADLQRVRDFISEKSHHMKRV